MTYPAAQPHDPLKQIAEDVFVVHGSVLLNPIMRITRNMVVVRNAGELTLISAVRMDDEGLKALEALGDIKHVIRLGPLHGLDDPFYVDRYNAEFWSFDDGTTYVAPSLTQTLSDGCALPFPDAQLFGFDHMSETEGAILLNRGDGLLITVDAVQTYSTPPHMPHTGWLARKLMPFAGFPDKTIIGPIWVKKMVTDEAGIAREFQRLLALPFNQLISAHGTFLASGAHEEVEQAYEAMFGGA